MDEDARGIRAVPHSLILSAEYRRGLEDARAVLVDATAYVTDPDMLEVLARAFADLNRVISGVAGVIVGNERIDYVERVQVKARAAGNAGGSASVKTPIGELTCMTWIDAGKRQSEYTLAGSRISVREMKALGLAQRPTTRNRRPK
jgi:hypothetical protein